jgi:uncharacterized protein YpbB
MLRIPGRTNNVSLDLRSTSNKMNSVTNSMQQTMNTIRDGSKVNRINNILDN